VPGATCYAFVACAAEAAAVRRWLQPAHPALRFVPQVQHPDLGARMVHALSHVLSLGHPRAAVVGTDVPGLSAATLTAALGALEHSQAAFGPAEDGGYYLFGLKASEVPEGLFSGVEWSCAETLRQSVASVGRLGLTLAPLASLPTLPDIDTRDDLERWVCAQEGAGDGLEQSDALRVAREVLLLPRDAHGT
jgi:glycosyltransferase A (GT-A) superfamily protein (DUF2064 family)